MDKRRCTNAELSLTLIQRCYVAFVKSCHGQVVILFIAELYISGYLIM